jgi:hypothetical protein
MACAAMLHVLYGAYALILAFGNKSYPKKAISENISNYLSN